MGAPKYRYTENRKGDAIIPQGGGIYNQSATALATLGDRLVFGDGRVFRYAKAGAVALAAGKLCKAGVVVDAGATNKVFNGNAAIGAYSCSLETTFACTTCSEGFLQINDATGEGIQYKIKSGAANATTSTYTDLTLYDPIKVALVDNTSEGTIVFNPYEQVEVCSAVTDIIVGVPPIAVTAEYYFWIQTWGPACVYSEGAPAAGTVVEVGVNSNPAGTTTCNADTALGVGVQMAVGVNGEYKPVWLRIAP